MAKISVTVHGEAETIDFAAALKAIEAGAPAGAPTITGTGGADEIDGTGAGEVILGLGGADELRGRGGDDTVDGGDGNDRARGDGGDDIVRGGNGNDKVEGKAGNDEVYGGSGRDEVKGGGGNDIVDGGTGADDLWGNIGLDTFVFAPGSGNDKIHDFSFTDDVVDLTAYGFASVAEVLAKLTLVSENDTLLRLTDTDSIRFDNRLPGGFSADDFLV